MEFNERLRELREEKEMLQRQLGELLQVQQATVSAWEKGKAEPPIDILKKIAEIFGCDVNYLVGFAD